MKAATEVKTKLITGLGTKKYDPCSYYIEGCRERKSSVTRFAAIGLAELVDHEQPMEIVVLVTQAVKQSGNDKLLQDEINRRLEGNHCKRWQLRSQEIPEGKHEEEMWQIFEVIGQHIEQGDQVIIDITNGYRSLPIIMISAAQYYLHLKKAAGLKVYYGAFDAGTLVKDEQGRELNMAPIIDITLITSISDWTYGLRLFDEHLIASPLAEQLERLDKSKGSQQIVKNLKSLDFYLRQALPLEIGITARQLRSSINRFKEQQIQPKRRAVEEQFFTSLQALLEEIDVDCSKKEEATLDLKELLRQANIIERYLNKNIFGNGVVLMREWLVSTYIWYSQEDVSKWLDNSTRKKYEEDLSKISKAGPNRTNDKLLSKLRESWKVVRDNRNTFAHAGMNPKPYPPDDITNIKTKLRELYCLLREKTHERARA